MKAKVLKEAKVPAPATFTKITIQIKSKSNEILIILKMSLSNGDDKLCRIKQNGKVLALFHCRSVPIQNPCSCPVLLLHCHIQCTVL